jgi:hypothetical protein
LPLLLPLNSPGLLFFTLHLVTTPSRSTATSSHIKPCFRHEVRFHYYLFLIVFFPLRFHSCEVFVVFSLFLHRFLFAIVIISCLQSVHLIALHCFDFYIFQGSTDREKSNKSTSAVRDLLQRLHDFDLAMIDTRPDTLPDIVSPGQRSSSPVADIVASHTDPSHDRIHDVLVSKDVSPQSCSIKISQPDVSPLPIIKHRPSTTQPPLSPQPRSVMSPRSRRQLPTPPHLASTRFYVKKSFQILLLSSGFPFTSSFTFPSA